MTSTTNTADHRSLYEVTGDIKDINTMLVPRSTLAAPAQAGEYPELPIRYATYDAWGNQTKHGYNAKDMHAYVDADRVARSPASQPVAAPVGMEPVAWVEVRPGLDGWFLAYNFNPDAQTEPLYSGFQVQAMLAAARKPLADAPCHQGDMRKYVEAFAAKSGWNPGSGEGAFEYAQRICYSQGFEDATIQSQRKTHAAPVQAMPVRTPLTDRQIGAVIDEVAITSRYGNHHFGRWMDFARAIEAEHGIKATNQESNK